MLLLVEIVIIFAACIFSSKAIFTWGAATEIPLEVGFVHSYEMEQTEHGLEFRCIDEDPYFVSENSMKFCNGIHLEFAQPVEKDLITQVFFARKGKVFSEDESVAYMIPEGTLSYDIVFPTGKYIYLRTDIEGDYVLKSISATGSMRMNPIPYVFYWIIIGAVCTGLFLSWDKLCYGYDKVTSIIYKIFVKSKIQIWHIFVIFATVLGITYAFLIPPMQVPDEGTHYTMMIDELGITDYSSEIFDYYGETGLWAIAGYVSDPVNPTLFNEHMGDYFTKPLRFESLPSIAIIRHLPAAVGFLIGRCLMVSIFWNLMLAEFAALAFYVFMGALSLKIMPIKKELLMAIMLLPTTIQQCASVNYDSVCLPCCFLLIAICMDCVYGTRKIHWKCVGILLTLLIPIVLTKPPYVLITLVLLMAPDKNWNLKIGNWDIWKIYRKRPWIYILCAIIVIATTGFIIRDNSYVKLFVSLIAEGKQYIKLLYHTLRFNDQYYYESMVAVLGWLEVRMNRRFYWMSFLFLLLLSQSKESPKIAVRERIFFGGIFLGTFILITTILLSWNFYLNSYNLSSMTFTEIREAILSYDIILGIQGRYYTPILLLGFIPLHGLLRFDKKDMMLLQFLYYPFIIIEPLRVIIERYWCAF